MLNLREHVSCKNVIGNTVNRDMTVGTQLNRNPPFLIRRVLVPLLHKTLERPAVDAAMTYVDAMLIGKENYKSFSMNWEV